MLFHMFYGDKSLVIGKNECREANKNQKPAQLCTKDEAWTLFLIQN